ncbi:hypothetical protein UlMin_009193 [Ulmus minor]
MARKGNQHKNGIDRHASNHKKKSSDLGGANEAKGQEKAGEAKVVPGGDELPSGSQPSCPEARSVNKNNYAGDEHKSSPKSTKPLKKEKQQVDGIQGMEQPKPSRNDSGDCNGNTETPRVTKKNGSLPRSDQGHKLRQSRIPGSLNGHIQRLRQKIELSDNVVVRNLKVVALSTFKAANEWLENQRPLFIRLKANTQDAQDYVKTKIALAYPIVSKWVLQLGSIMLLISMVWLDCALRGIDSFVRMGTTSFFSVIWCSILSVIAMVGIFKFLIVLGLAALIGVFVGLTLAILVVAISGALFLWLYGSFWTTLSVIFLGGLAFALNREQIALLITTVYSMYCAWAYVGWLGLLVAINLSFISSDVLIYFLKNYQQRRSNSFPETPGMQGQPGFFSSEQNHASFAETGPGFSFDRSPGVPSTSGADSDITSEDEVVRLLNCTDHYSVLGFSRYENVDVSLLKREYRKKAMLVHPDKNMGNEKAAEAFKKLQNAYEVLLDSVKQKAYDDELRREEILNIFQRFRSRSQMNEGHGFYSSEFAQSEADGEDPSGYYRQIACKRCRMFHHWELTRKSKSRARWCQECKDFHPAKDGDGWVEQSSQPFFLGLLQKVDPPKVYVCADGKIYNATAWYICQGMRCPANTHKPSFHVNTSLASKHNTGKGSTSGQRGARMPPSSMEDCTTEEELYEWLQNAMQAGMFDNTGGSSSNAAENPSSKPGSGSGGKRKKKGKKQW